MFLMSESMQNLTTIAMPVIIAAITFLVTIFKLIGKLQEIFKNSNLENIADNIKVNQVAIGQHVEEILIAYKEMAHENAELKKQNKELKELITKVKE